MKQRITCPKGKYCAGNAVVNPEPCPAGTYLETEGASSQSACIECSLNTYSPSVGAISSTTCTSCPADRPNSPQGSKGESECVNTLVCANDEQISSDGTKCVKACAFGNYSDASTGQCEQCPVGTFNRNGFAAM